MYLEHTALPYEIFIMIVEKEFIWRIYWDLMIVSFDWMKGRHRIVTCICNCWNTKQMIFNNIKKWKSCGCKKWNIKNWYWDKEHTYYDINKIYSWIKYRCYNKNHIRADYYSKKWIKMSQEWFENVDVFIEDMYKTYKEHCLLYWKLNTTIDRIDNDWDYCRENCKRSTKAEQNNNTSRNVFFNYNWEYITQKQLSKELWVPAGYIRYRISTWLSKEEVIDYFIKQKWFLRENNLLSDTD